MEEKVSFYTHAYARGVDKRITFLDETDYIRFFLALTLSRFPHAPSMSIFLVQIEKGLIHSRSFTKKALQRSFGKPNVDILSAVLMPNHFHLQLKFFEIHECSKFLQRLLGSYTKYFNNRHQREGHLFSSRTQRRSIVTDEQNNYLTKYIHTNPIFSSNTKSSNNDLENYRWSTYPQYLRKHKPFILKNNLLFDTSYFCNPTPILNQFKSPVYYKKFVLSQEDYGNLLNDKSLIDQSE